MKRSLQNPLITRLDIPRISSHLSDVSSVFNPGAIRFGDNILLLLRVQNRGRETFLLPASSDDGIKFAVGHEPVRIAGIEKVHYHVYHIYDPRITAIDGQYYVTFAMDIDGGCRIGIARTSDFSSYEFVSIPFYEDVRNGVLFPEKIDGEYALLYRPNRTTLDGGVTTGSAIEFATSKDLHHWEPKGVVIRGRWHYWDELIGSGPSPIKTRHGWLHIYHGVATHFASSNIYQAGVVLLDLKEPWRVIARSRQNILEPREMYELVGQVPNVVFPSGLVPKQVGADGFVPDDSELFIYYGAADTCVGMATTTVGELVDECEGI